MHDLPTTDLHKLLDDLRSVKGPSRELSDRVLLAMGWSRRPYFDKGRPGLGSRLTMFSPEGKILSPLPHPTGSLDDAVGLVPEDRPWGVHRERGKYYSIIPLGGYETAERPALALSAALIAMKIAESET